MDTIKFSLVKDTFNLERNAQRDINLRYCEKVSIVNRLMRMNDQEGAKLVANQPFSGSPVNITGNPELTPDAIRSEIVKEQEIEKAKKRTEELKKQEKEFRAKEYPPTKFNEIHVPERIVNTETSGNVSRRIQTDGTRLPTSEYGKDEVSAKIMKDAGRPYIYKGVFYNSNDPLPFVKEETKVRAPTSLQSTTQRTPFVHGGVPVSPFIPQTMGDVLSLANQNPAPQTYIPSYEVKETQEQKEMRFELSAFDATQLKDLAKSLKLPSKEYNVGRGNLFALLIGKRYNETKNFLAHHKGSHPQTGYGLRKKRKPIRGGNLRKAGTGYSKGYLPASKELLKQKISVLAGELSAGNDGVKSVLKKLAGSAIKKGILTKAQVKKLVS